ncbi:MAG TPA: carboxymuconolactone decarboxylase family protein [Candidatus Angelobacter sp.]|nr:carboxymuconolactone decarboxylase family protein [Candidatus Angelobacter sp.]
MARRLGSTDDQIQDLHNFEARNDFSDREKAALRLAECLTKNPHGIDDHFWSDLRQHFDEGEVIELLAVIGLFNYFNRFNNALQMEPTK